MATNLAHCFQARRRDRGLRLGQRARLLGYRNVSQGAHRIVRFEREGVIDEPLLGPLAGVLRVDVPTVEQLIRQDREESLRAWEAWVNEPVPRTWSRVDGDIFSDGNSSRRLRATGNP
jgi:hypothetical protein